MLPWCECVHRAACVPDGDGQRCGRGAASLAPYLRESLRGYKHCVLHVRLRVATEPLTWSGRSIAASETACVRSRELRSVRSRTLLILLVTVRTERMKPLAGACKGPLLAIALVLGLEAA